MQNDDTELLTGVRVLGIVVDGDDVLVDVYGSDENIVGSVRYRFPDATERRSHARVLHRWAAADTPVTMVSNGRVITLLDEQALLQRALSE